MSDVGIQSARTGSNVVLSGGVTAAAVKPRRKMWGKLHMLRWVHRHLTIKIAFGVLSVIYGPYSV
jgi:hypothetical protein